MNIDRDLLIRFEESLDPRYPEQSEVAARVLGFGEISTVLEIGNTPEQKQFAYKRMPLFKSRKEIERYRANYAKYHIILQEVGIRVPEHDTVDFQTSDGRLLFYGVQRKVDYHAIGNRIIHYAANEDINKLFIRILHKLNDVFIYNARNKGRVEIGIDSQISNWALVGFTNRSPVVADEMDLVYIDTSTPLIKLNGEEQLDPELFLRSAPSFLVWFIRRFFLQEVMERYYDFRKVTIDIIANFYKEQRADLVPHLVGLANDFFANEARAFDIQPLSVEEIRSYYREDAFIWRFYLFARKTDRFLHKLAGKPYWYILPDKVQR